MDEIEAHIQAHEQHPDPDPSFLLVLIKLHARVGVVVDLSLGLQLKVGAQEPSGHHENRCHNEAVAVEHVQKQKLLQQVVLLLGEARHRENTREEVAERQIYNHDLAKEPHEQQVGNPNGFVVAQKGPRHEDPVV